MIINIFCSHSFVWLVINTWLFITPRFKAYEKGQRIIFGTNVLIENLNKKIGFYSQRSPINWSLSSTLSLFISRYFITKTSNDCLPHAKSKQISILHEADCQLNENFYALLNCHACSFKTTKLANLKKKTKNGL